MTPISSASELLTDSWVPQGSFYYGRGAGGTARELRVRKLLVGLQP